MSEEPSRHGSGTGEQMSKQTRRQALKAIGVAGVGGVAVPGVVSARSDDELSTEVEEWAPEWWTEQKLAASDRADVEVVSEGVTEWVSEDDEAPDWFTINEEDELRYKPHGTFRTEGAELCLPTSVDVGSVTVGLELCHYGGCEWKLEACLGGCVGTGMNDSCSGYYSLGVDLGVVDGTLEMYPEGDLIGTTFILTGMDVEGELCYYYVTGSDCSTVSHEYDLY